MKNDIIWGAAAIGEYVGVQERQVYYWADNASGPPIKKEGRRLFAFKTQLNRYFGYDGDAPPAVEHRPGPAL